MSHRTTHLFNFKVARSLGTKPEPLKSIEKRLWQVLLKLACGKECSNDVRDIMRVANMQQKDSSIAPEWFVAGTSTYFNLQHNCSPTLSHHSYTQPGFGILHTLQFSTDHDSFPSDQPQ